MPTEGRRRILVGSFLARFFPSILKSTELIVFPSFCHLCSALLQLPGEKVVCRSCMENLIPHRGSYCICCGRFFSGAADPHVCSSCLENKKAYSRHRSCGLYQGKLKDIILLIKYRQFKVLGKGLADFVSRSLDQDESFFPGADYLVPVPLHPRKERKRGFNQAREIAFWLGKKHSIPLLDRVLVKTKNNPAQTTLESKQRWMNVKNAYAVKKPALIAGKTLILIDDVFTTGATINECSRVLKKAGAREVRCITIAQAFWYS